MINPSFVFTDNAVLQRDKEIRIFGECDLEKLTVSFAGKRKIHRNTSSYAGRYLRRTHI